MSDPREVKVTLVKARDLITPIEHWCTGTERRVRGDGFAYCAIGAVRQVVGGFNGHSNDYHTATEYEDAVALLDMVAEMYPEEYGDIMDLNDSTGDHAMVIEAFDKAIRLAAERLVGSP